MSILSPEAAANSSAYAIPVQKKERILFLDSIRGIALLGILLMNSMAQSQPHFFYERMDLSQPITGPNFYAWLVECFLFEGTMRGLFSILFGAGTILFLSRLTKEKPGLEPADIFYRRMLWLLVFGLINAFIFLWPGDILYPYALCGLLLFPFRNLQPKYLLWAAFFLLLLSTWRENNELYEKKDAIRKGKAVAAIDTSKVKLTEEQKDDLGKYISFKEKNDTAGIAKGAKEEMKKVKGKFYLGVFSYYKDINMIIQSIGFYNSWWDMLMFFFIGMALYKSGFLVGSKPNYVYTIVAVAGIGIGLLLNYFILRTQYRLRFDNYQFVQQWRFSFYDIRRVCQTLGYLSLLILLYKITPVKKLLHVFAPVGQMAFTNYLSQSIITSAIFYALGYYSTLQRYEVYYIVVGIWIFQLVFSHIWMRYFLFGPFEWVWRSLTYLYRPPMRRNKETLTAQSVVV